MSTDPNRELDPNLPPGAPRPGAANWLKRILLALVVIVGGLLLVISLQPAQFKVERSAKIAAPPADVFAQVNDFHNWDGWSPWAKLDPNMKQTFEGAPTGEGAIYTWTGNSDVGEGKMTILESKPNELIKIKLEFFRPMASTNSTEFHFKPADDGTEVTWKMEGENDFMGKAFSLLMNMDKMLSDSFDEGLGKIKSIVEKKPS